MRKVGLLLMITSILYRKIFLYPVVLILFALCLHNRSAFAFEYEFEGDAMEGLFSLSLEDLQNVKISVASGFEQSIAEAPSTVTLITEAQWQAMGATTLDEVLESIPGIHISLSQSALTSDVISIRGLQTSLNHQLMILIDGEHIRSSTGGSTVFGFKKSLTGLKQIEVVRGPGSAIYGADSFSGVINLVTKKASSGTSSEQGSSNLGFRFGSFASKHGWLENQGKFASIDYRLTIDLFSSDDDKNRKINADLQTFLDSIFATAASLAPGPIDNHYNIQDITLNLAGEDWNANIWHYRNNRAGLGPGAAQALDPFGSFTNGITLAKLQFDMSDYLSGKANIDFSMQREFIHTKYHLFPAGTVLPIGNDGNIDFVTPTTFTLFTDGFLGNPKFVSKTFALSLTQIKELTKSHKLRWKLGINYNDRDVGETKNFGPTILSGTESVIDGMLTDVDNTPGLYSIDTKEHFTYLSIQDDWRINNDVSAVIGLRYDNYESFGSTVNPRISLIWRASNDLTTKFQYGSAFRAPSPDERFFRNNPVTLGNEDLQPEEIDTIELSFDYKWHKNLITNFTWYQYEAKNFIEFVYDPNFNGNVAQNIGQQSGDGIETSIKWQTNQLNIEFNYSHINAKKSPLEQPISKTSLSNIW